MNEREYLVSLGLAKPGVVGRFSKQAHKALNDAREQGITFDKPVVVVSQVDTDVSNARKWARENGINVGVRGRLRPEILTAYNANDPSLAGIVEVTTINTVTESDHTVVTQSNHKPVAKSDKNDSKDTRSALITDGFDAEYEYVDPAGKKWVIGAANSCGNCRVSLAGHTCDNPTALVGGNLGFVPVKRIK